MYVFDAVAVSLIHSLFPSSANELEPSNLEGGSGGGGGGGDWGSEPPASRAIYSRVPALSLFFSIFPSSYHLMNPASQFPHSLLLRSVPFPPPILPDFPPLPPHLITHATEISFKGVMSRTTHLEKIYNFFKFVIRLNLCQSKPPLFIFGFLLLR